MTRRMRRLFWTAMVAGTIVTCAAVHDEQVVRAGVSCDRAIPGQNAAISGDATEPVPVQPEFEEAIRCLVPYRAELAAFRREFGGAREMPDVPFFQFGMGARTKYLYRDGVLRNAITGTVLASWDVKSQVVVPPDYRVCLVTADHRCVQIREDERAVWICDNGRQREVTGTNSPLHLPAFREHRFASVLRVLHHEILMNVVEGLPVPNLFVYKKPWYRDGAMMAMCLRDTGNLALIRDWILGLTDPYDRNNAGETEADNLGQALFLVSLVSDNNHPLVSRIRQELAKFETRRDHVLYLRGRSDFAFHPVYQTKWAKYGLKALGLPDPYSVPSVADSYSSLFWMDYRDHHVAGSEATNRDFYPYLGWATDHFQRAKLSPISNRDYPLTWESRASQADYAGMAIVDQVFVDQKTCLPHTWHAAEIFLYLRDPRMLGDAQQAAGR